MSMPGDAIAAIVNRSASAPMSSITDSGSTTLPFDLLIFWPRSSRTSPVMYTVWNGTSPANFRPSMIIRATQKKMMSNPVSSSVVG